MPFMPAPLWKKNLYILWIAQFIAMIAMSACLPFLPLYVRELGVSGLKEAQQWSGLIMAAPFLFSVITAPIWGALGDKYGRKLMVVRAIIGLAVAMALMGFAQNVWQLLLLRIFQGAVSGFIASTLAFVSATTPPRRAGYAIGLLQSTLSAGNIVGALVGGVLSDVIGMRNVFFFVGAMCLISSVIVIAYVVEERVAISERKPSSSVRANFLFAWNTPSLRNILFLIIAAQSAIVFVSPVMPFYLEYLGAPKEYLSTLTGLIVGIVGVFSVIFAPYWGRRNDRKGHVKTLRVAALAVGISTILQSFVPSYEYLFGLRAIIGIFTAAIIPTLYTAFSKNTPTDNRSGMMGLASSASLLGNLMSPSLSGWIASHAGMRWCFAIAGAIMLVVSFSTGKEQTK
ncbi:MAG: MFS transporter [Bacteroidetes bacterium]|nr:MFS transporter [Bacteroidota bacterium]